MSEQYTSPVDALEAARASAFRLVEMYKSGLLGGEVMPEDALLDVVPEQALPNVITLGMALNYQRNSYALWRSIATTYTDPDRSWVFDFPSIAASEPEALREALVAHKVALQPNKHTQIWHTIAGTLQASGGAKGLIQSHGQSIARLKDYVQQTNKPSFPYLSGPKIFNYWLYVMESYCGVAWEDREEITIAPDTHVLQASVHLGIVPESVLDGSAKSRELVAKAWKDLLHDSSLAPIDIHTPLWLWSRGGFIEIQ